MASDTEELVLSISADTRQIMNAIKRLEKDIGTSAAGVEKSFARIGKGIDKSIDTTVQKRINEITGVGVAATKEWTGALADQGKELERMRARFNPIFAVVARYKATVTEIQTAQRLGAISTDEMTAAIQRERQAALASIAALKQRNAVLDSAAARRGGSSTFNTANIAAQFQDVAVTSAMGMSPLQIALQQGTQLSAVLNEMGRSRHVIAGLGAAFSSIVNPVSLVTIGVVGLTAAAIQLSSTVLSGSADVQDALKEHQRTIADLRKAYGLAGDGADEYSRRSIAALEAAERRARAVLREAIAAQEKTIQTSLSDFGISGFGLLERFGLVGDRTLSAVSARFAAFADPIRRLRSEIQQGKPDYDAFQQTLESIVSTDPARLRPVADEIIKIIDEAASGREHLEALDKHLSDLSTLNPDTSKAQNAILSIGDAAAVAMDRIADLVVQGQAIRNMLAGMDALAREVAPKGDAIGGKGTMDRAQEEFRAQFNMWRRFGYDNDSGIDPNKPKKTPAAKVPRRTADDRFFEDIEAIRQRTVALAEERAQLGLSYEAQQKRKIAFDLEQKALKDVREEARRKGEQDWQNAQLSSDQARQIDEVSSAYARQADQLRKAQDQRAFWENAIYGLFSDLIPAIETGNKALDNFLNTLVEVAAQALLLGKGPFGGGGGGGLIGAFLSGLGIPFFASGTNYAPGGLAVVGERGPELVNLPRGAKVIPNHRITGPVVPSATMSGGSASQTTISMPIQINAPGADAAQLRRVEQSVQELGRNIPKIAVGAMQTTQTRRTRPA